MAWAERNDASLLTLRKQFFHVCRILSRFFFLMIDLFYVYEYTIDLFRHTRRRYQIPFQMFVSHHVVAGN